MAIKHGPGNNSDHNDCFKSYQKLKPNRFGMFASHDIWLSDTPFLIK